VFGKAAPFESPTKYDVRSVIRLLNAKRERPADNYILTVAVYGDVRNRKNVPKWCREFSEGRSDVHDEQMSGKRSSISGDLL